MDKLTAYNILGLQDGADEAAIKAAYRTLAQKYDVAQYEAGPLREEAVAKMNEINDAFDTLMSFLRTGKPPVDATYTAGTANTGAATGDNGQTVGKYPYIRQMINSGQIEDAIAELKNIPHGDSDAEWNFLMGSAYYYKGWLEQALRHFQAAVRLDPGNREYEAALRNLVNSSRGAMPGSPFATSNAGDMALQCGCNYCMTLCCMDAMCSICRGC